jgi:hypothetical protein
MATSCERIAVEKQVGKNSGCKVLLSFLLCFVAMVWSPSAVAQFTTARLGGTVTDKAGAAIAGATLRVEQVTTGYTQTGKAGSDGGYLFPSLPVGSYRLTVQMDGFTTYVQSGIELTVGQTATQNITLQVGAVAQQVTVQANSSLVTTQSASVSQLISQENMIALPLNGREAQQLVFLTPGTVDVTSQYSAEGGVFPGEQYAKTNGGGANGVYYLLDGVDYNDTYINANLPFPNPDALQEFNIQTDNMSAAYGNATGGVVNIVTKSGTNQIHGDAFEFLRNYAMDARNYFATSPDPLKQNQFGGTIGGPILKDKLFYFGAYQGTRTNTAANGQISFVPTAAERQGNFADLLPAGTQLVNPATGAPYPNNQLPSLNPVAQYLLQYIPLPNGPGRQLSYNGVPTIANTNEYLAKVDYILGKHHLSGHYFQMNYDIPLVTPLKSNILQANTESPQSITLKHVSVVDIYPISSNTLLNSYFGYTSQNGDTLSAEPFTIADAGSLIAQPVQVSDAKVMSVSVAGNFSIGKQHSTGVWDRGDQSFREVVTLVRNSHDIEFGGEFLRIRAPMSNTYQAAGIFSFNNTLSGDNVADFMLGDVSGFTQAGGLYLNFTGYNWNTFVQDTWHVSPGLTVTAGLRWDPFLPYTDSEGRVACFVPGAQSQRYPNSPQDLIFGGSNHDAGCPQSSIYNNLGNLGPRIGFSSRLTADGNTSVRGGAGFYYERPNTVSFEDIVGVPPFAPIVGLSAVNFTDPYGSAGVANPFPQQFGPRNPGPDATFPQDISFTQIFDRHFRLPQIFTWNLTLERGLGSDWLIRAAYIGNKGTHLGGTGDQESGLLQINPAIYIPGQSTEDNTQQRRVYPQFGFIDSINSGVNSNYDAVQLGLQKRFSRGFAFLTNFTWARALDSFGPNGSPGGNGTNTCTCGRYFDYGPSDGDVNKTFRISGNYNFPRVPVHSFADKLINGWSLSGITNWQTGFPFTIFSDYDNSFSQNGADRADLTAPQFKDALLSSGRSHAQLVNEWFNISAFGPNAIGTFGNTGKNVIRGPRFFDTDLGLLKNTKIDERVSLQFRAEFYNAFNNVNFGTPDSGLTDSSFGQITSAQDPRILQMALKATF